MPPSEPSRIAATSVEFSTPWFELVAKKVAGEAQPFYALRMLDYVTVVAITPARELLLVRQYRPAVERHTLELPSGHVEKGETPAQAARRELREECGYDASNLELLGSLLSDTGRHENRLWCYLAEDARPLEGGFTPEPGVEPVRAPVDSVPDLLARGELDHALNLAALLLVVARRGGRLFALL